jgi:hypothetical protein
MPASIQFEFEVGSYCRVSTVRLEEGSEDGYSGEKEKDATATEAEVSDGAVTVMDVEAEDEEGHVNGDDGEKEEDGTATRPGIEGRNILVVNANTGGEVDRWTLAMSMVVGSCISAPGGTLGAVDPH